MIRNPMHILRSGFEVIYNLKIKLFHQPGGNYKVAIHGIQRSGTNYLQHILEKNHVNVVNYYDPPRNSPRHKHFRWQPDKSTIVMDKRYANSTTVSSLSELNNVAQYSPDTKHIIIFKEPFEWLGSIYKWGLTNGWFVDETQFYESKAVAYLKEWDSYYCFWEKIQQRCAQNVYIINYNNLKSTPHDELYGAFETLKIDLPVMGSDYLIVDKVRHSKRFNTANRVLSIDRNKLNFEFQCGWQKYMQKIR